MTVRTFVHFDSTFEDDAVYDSDGNVLVPSGNVILSMLHERLNLAGYQLTAIEQHSFYGWRFDVKDAGLPAWLLLQVDWVLMIGKRGFLGRRVHWRSDTNNAHLVKLLKVIHGILASNSRIDNIRWYSESEENQSGTYQGHDFPTE